MDHLGSPLLLRIESLSSKKKVSRDHQPDQRDQGSRDHQPDQRDQVSRDHRPFPLPHKLWLEVIWRSYGGHGRTPRQAKVGRAMNTNSPTDSFSGNETFKLSRQVANEQSTIWPSHPPFSLSPFPTQACALFYYSCFHTYV